MTKRLPVTLAESTRYKKMPENVKRGVMDLLGMGDPTLQISYELKVSPSYVRMVGYDTGLRPRTRVSLAPTTKRTLVPDVQRDIAAFRAHLRW